MTALHPTLSTAGQESRDLDSARRTLEVEAEALMALRGALDDAFIQAVATMEAAQGRVIVTGMGKSGHVARKIAATLASTGRPAYFVHPAEASHGDLGMITGDDAVLALSNSGAVPELGDILAYCKRHRIPLIGMTGRAQSPLAEACDVVLLLPKFSEACPMGLAPTSSTTVMMALGDALAIALLERKGFSAADFRGFHPGGQLGRRLVRVADLMHGADHLPLANPETMMADAIVEMSAKGLGCVGIVDDEGALIGIVTDGDLRRHMSPQLIQMRAGDVMTPHPKSIRPQALAAEALAMMNLTDKPFTSLFVVEDHRPVGIIHVHDLLRAGVA